MEDIFAHNHEAVNPRSIYFTFISLQHKTHFEILPAGIADDLNCKCAQ